MQSPIFPVMEFPHLAAVPLPPVRRVRLHHPRSAPVPDLEAAVDRALGGSRRLAALPPGAEVALAVGSRGIKAIPRVVAATVRHLSGRGLRPFIVPAMGSHGGGTAEGQERLLANLGITEATVGAPVRSSMDTVVYGATSDGVPCHFDRHAAGADAIVVINRVKSHTTFDRPVESGLVKMVAVGLGKAEGARNVHRLGPRGLSEILPELARIALAQAPIAFGLALVENADKDIVAVEGAEPEDFFATDERLLKLAKSLLARLPFARIDALVVEYIGKEISGAGMDHAVTGRADMRGVPNPPKPFVAKIAVLDVTPKSNGNGLGIGLADFTTLAAVSHLDLRAIYMNSLTSTLCEKARIPIVLPCDRDAVRAAVATSWCNDPASARLCVIRSTLHLDEVLASPALLAAHGDDPMVEPVGDPFALGFDGDGRLTTRAAGEGSTR